MLPFQAGKKSGFQFQNCYSIRCQSIWTLCLVRQQSQNHFWLLSTPWQLQRWNFPTFCNFPKCCEASFFAPSCQRATGHLHKLLPSQNSILKRRKKKDTYIFYYKTTNTNSSKAIWKKKNQLWSEDLELNEASALLLSTRLTDVKSWVGSLFPKAKQNRRSIFLRLCTVNWITSKIYFLECWVNGSISKTPAVWAEGLEFSLQHGA